MRYLVGFVVAVVLGAAACGDEQREPCDAVEDCDQTNACVRTRCIGPPGGYCSYAAVDCEEEATFCRRYPSDECDPESDQVCGAFVPLNEGKSCCETGSYECIGGYCLCPADTMSCMCVGYLPSGGRS